MASQRAIAAAGRSVVALLNRRFGEIPAVELPNGRVATAALIGTPDFAQVSAQTAFAFPAVTVYVYRVTVDAETRASCSQATAIDGKARVPLCVHFLITAWDDNADFELQWLGYAIEALERDASLSGPLLDAIGDWSLTESVQIVADEVNLQSMSEAFTALKTDFRLSMPYIARVVRIVSPPEPLPERVATVVADAGRLVNA